MNPSLLKGIEVLLVTLFAFQVPVNIHKFFATYKKLKIHMEVEKEGMPEILKLKDWPAESDFGERLPRHGDDFISSLPFHQYTHPSHGILNLATKFPEGSLTPDLGPKSYIGYGVKQELLKGDSVTKLHLDMADAVNYSSFFHCSVWTLRILFFR